MSRITSKNEEGASRYGNAGVHVRHVKESTIKPATSSPQYKCKNRCSHLGATTDESSLLTRHFQMGYAAGMVVVMESLQNYRNLVARVDALCRRILLEYGETVFCREGCDGCCRHISLFPVEAVALAWALSALPARQSARIRNMARAASAAAACPLLENGRCLLYEARPIICRTHGFPLLADRGGEREIDFCPKNFNGVTSFPAAYVLDLDLLNTTLVAINAVFTASTGFSLRSDQDRLTIAEALLLEVLF